MLARDTTSCDDTRLENPLGWKGGGGRVGHHDRFDNKRGCNTVSYTGHFKGEGRRNWFVISENEKGENKTHASLLKSVIYFNMHSPQ